MKSISIRCEANGNTKKLNGTNLYFDSENKVVQMTIIYPSSAPLNKWIQVTTSNSNGNVYLGTENTVTLILDNSYFITGSLTLRPYALGVNEEREIWDSMEYQVKNSNWQEGSLNPLPDVVASLQVQLSQKIPKIPSAEENNIVLFNSDGTIKDSGLSIPEITANIPYNQSPSPLSTTPSAGIVADYSRGDHSHQLPSASDVGAEASGTAAGLVSGLVVDLTSGVTEPAYAVNAGNTTFFRNTEPSEYVLQTEKGAVNGVSPLDDKASVLFQNGYRLYSPTPSMGGISDWEAPHVYLRGNLVMQGGVTYQCKTAHTSGVFATDLAAVKWVVDAFPLRGNIIIGNGGTGLTTTSDVLEHPDFGGQYKGKLNTIFGMDAGLAITSACFNTFIGYSAGTSTTTGDQNTYIGNSAGQLNTTGYHNTAVGVGAMQVNVEGFYNNYFGTDCGLWDNGGWENVVIGTSSGVGTGSENVVVGCECGNPQYSTVSFNTFVGFASAARLTTGQNNVFVGFETGFYNTTGYANVFVGYKTGLTNTTGCNNVFIGNLSGTANTAGDSNTAVGESSCLNNTTGTFNVALGKRALAGNTNGVGNIGIGANALNANAVGAYSIAIGYQSLFYAVAATTGDAVRSNLGVGYRTGLGLTSGSGNTFIGTLADTSLATIVNSMALGNGAIVTTSNTVQIGNGAVTNVLTNGSFETKDIGDGFICKSPDGTRYKITVANGGTIAIAAA